jgi:hypothetical protein
MVESVKLSVTRNAMRINAGATRLLSRTSAPVGRQMVMAAALQINFALWGMIICAGCEIRQLTSLFF